MKRMKKKSLLLVAGIVLMLTIAIGGTIAYIVTNTESITNTFEPGRVPIRIYENFGGGEKSYVWIRNDGNVPAYIRAKIVVTWKDKDGNVSAIKPERDKHYKISIDTTQWQYADDGFYYYPDAVEPGKGTGTSLISQCTTDPSFPPPDGYDLSVEIIAESIQADGMDGVSNAQQAFAAAKNQ